MPRPKVPQRAARPDTVKVAHVTEMTPFERSIRQMGRDATSGGKELVRQGTAAVEKVKAGYRKVKAFLSK